MTPEEFEIELIILNETLDSPEDFHIQSDKLIYQLLKELGYGKGIDIIEKRERWYS